MKEDNSQQKVQDSCENLKIEKKNTLSDKF